MSYSITARGKTKDAVCEQIAKKMAEVIAQQPTHKADAGTAAGAAMAYVAVLTEEEGKDIVLEMNGSVSWTYPATEGQEKITHANVSIRAYTVAAT